MHLKIALAHKRLDRKGGTEIDFYRTAEGLRDLGHEVHLFCSEYESAPPVGTFPHRVPYLAFGRTARLWSFACLAPRLIERELCDLVVSFGRMLRQDVLRSGGGSHKVFLQKMAQDGGWRRSFWHSISFYHRSVLAIEKRQFREGRARRILCVSEEIKREIVANYGVSEEKLAVIYNGVDAERFHPSVDSKARAEIRKRWSIPVESPLVLFVGSGFRRKGLDRLLRVWNATELRNAYLLVVGEDAERSRYQAWAARDVGNRVVFAGRQTDIENYYGAADLLALPAIQEAFGNVVLEALASGLPVVVSSGVGAAEVLRGELTAGIVAQADHPGQLEAKLLSMLEWGRLPGSTEKARKLGEAHSWKNHFARLEQELIDVARYKRGGAAC